MYTNGKGLRRDVVLVVEHAATRFGSGSRVVKGIWQPPSAVISILSETRMELSFVPLMVVVVAVQNFIRMNPGKDPVEHALNFEASRVHNCTTVSLAGFSLVPIFLSDNQCHPREHSRDVPWPSTLALFACDYYYSVLSGGKLNHYSHLIGP
ncbi:hypothetical protein BS47DRAFT_409444 [Hydnum rufescens UP504]|uniref:Uncharacterized protein n=1 Tax=Hydnum rufescens UP504 TaxID=1448309 RepID=A0A9P6BBN8_9AGAM|nr:hypothetical protein BS47DRAFT_409444 [Hydnum rufescens UP504]